VPAGRDVELILRSEDYLYRFAVPGLGLYGMAVPGLPSSVTFRAPRPGTFDLGADPMCGRRPAHGVRLIVEDPPGFASWLASAGRSAATRARSAPRRMGEALAAGGAGVRSEADRDVPTDRTLGASATRRGFRGPLDP
jgi:cytochrome c oxidase subunit 2